MPGSTGNYENPRTPVDQPEALRRIVMTKGEHRWIFRYSPGEEDSLVEALATLAEAPDTGFDWFDGAVICNQLEGYVAGLDPPS